MQAIALRPLTARAEAASLRRFSDGGAFPRNLRYWVVNLEEVEDVLKEPGISPGERREGERARRVRPLIPAPPAVAQPRVPAILVEEPGLVRA